MLGDLAVGSQESDEDLLAQAEFESVILES
jgi:hypothetical protein